MAQRKRKRRKLSKAQRDALAKGRRALSRKRGKRRKRTTKKKRSSGGVSGHRVIVLPEGTKMAGRKRKRKRSKARRRRSYRGAAGGVPVAGRRRRRRRYYGGGKVDFMQPIMDGAMVVGGAVGGSFVAGAIPGVPGNIKPFIPMIGGLLLNAMPQTRKQPMLRMIGIGMITASGLSLVRQFAPQVPLMTGEVEDELLGVPLMGLDEDELDMLGVDEDDLDMLGEAEDELEGEFATSADM